MATSLLRDCAVQLSMLLAMFENVAQAHVLVTQVPLECLKAFIETQSSQNVAPDASLQGKLKASWAAAGVPEEQFQSFAHALLKLRADHDPPYILLFSRVDKAALIVVCRHEAQLGSYQSSMPGIARMVRKNTW